MISCMRCFRRFAKVAGNETCISSALTISLSSPGLETESDLSTSRISRKSRRNAPSVARCLGPRKDFQIAVVEGIAQRACRCADPPSDCTPYQCRRYSALRALTSFGRYTAIPKAAPVPPPMRAPIHAPFDKGSVLAINLKTIYATNGTAPLAP